ncbi:exodeoxyribonuclease V subunit gamma [Rubrivirga marina]|uniref:RecC C-terminal domain-containing protein n=1 Tax=Rubrivirga marina TaxID=1196024 RepID=A0A271IYF4_9BACT|nr:exodeoxyribonuclease V subunit gamma [Rubrivirga marina]PAP76286.1 hypothetical protein BSZ37_07415 [Rubrivirga marina]
MPSSPPGFSVVTAPCLEPLLDRLVETVEGDPLDPLQRETIVVARNTGLRTWLTHALAQRLGCAASLDLPAPVSLVARLAGVSGGTQPYEAGPLAWRLKPVLDALPDEAVFEPLRAYLDKTDGQTMPLAKRLAELFDDYQVYRPDVLRGWERGRDSHSQFQHGAWQAALWRLLRSDGLPDRASAFTTLERRLAEAAPNLSLPPRLAVFGALLFPPAYYRVVAGIARHRPVTLYAVTSGPQPTTQPHAHPLLRALGTRTRHFWHVLGELGAPPPARLGPVRLGTEAGEATALQELQRALADDELPAPTPLAASDRSVRVHDCHSPRRELEALRDALLDAFAEMPDLRPADVLVLLPDLDTYAPLVDAVFGAEDAAEGARLPVHVVHHPHAPALRVVEAFRKALRMHDGRVTASELLDLLSYPVVRQAAGIREDEIPRLRAWVAEAGVCWGLTGARKAQFGLPEDDLHTWRFGLDRLLLGVMTGDTPNLVLGHAPCDAAGLDGADLLGRFSEWAEALFSRLGALDRERRLADWPAHLLLFLDAVFTPEADEELEAVVFLRTKIAEIESLHELAEAEAAAVSFRAVRAHLDGATGTMEVREPVLTGRVTFADPLVLRHAPHRVVAVLGLNDGVWPRPETLPGFDLIAHDPHPGDAHPRETEKQLFLDAVLAARDRLILSHVGRSQKDNAPRAASVCLDAFLDAARQHWGADADRLVVRHRLQPFAADYFRLGAEAGGDDAAPLPPSYASQHRVARGRTGDPAPFLDIQRLLPDAAPDGDDVPTLPLAELTAAWTNPSQYVVRRRLRASLDLDDDAVRDDEPVVLDGLERWRIRQEVLEGLLDGLDDDALSARLLRCGLLPGGAPGAAWLRRAREEAAPIAEAVRSWGPTEPRAVEIEVGGVRLVGTVAAVGERGALRYRAGSVRGKDLVGAWVDHLALEAATPVGCTCTVGRDEVVHFGGVPSDDARTFLAALVKGWRLVQTRSLPLYEYASYAYAQTLTEGQIGEFVSRVLRPRDVEFEPNGKAMGKARSAFSPFKGGPTPKRGDDDDANVLLVTRDRDPFVPEEHFAKWALGLWAPILHHRRSGLPS